MFSYLATLPRLATGLAVSVVLSTQAIAQGAEAQLSESIREIEDTLDARVGVLITDSASDWSWAHRSDERFLMNSTSKVLLCGAVLDGVDGGTLDLGEPIKIAAEDILDYAPVTTPQVGNVMPIGDLCLATLDMSDNTAANLLIDRLGGPQEITAFLRNVGDPVSRFDRREPDLNTPAPDGALDTTTPTAILSTLESLLLGDALTWTSRTQLRNWMSLGGVTGGLIRASTPEEWQVSDKSGSGDGSRNIIAMITPAGDDPYFVAIYLADAEADFDTRNAALKDIAAAVVDVLITR